MSESSTHIPKFSDDAVQRRIVFLCERCEAFLNAIKTRHTAWRPLSFDPLVMISLTKSAMDDIWRWKAYHLQNSEEPRRANAIKRASYFTKWIVKARPIYFPRPLDAAAFAEQFDPFDSTLLLNEAFALQVALRYLATEAARTLKPENPPSGVNIAPIILSNQLHASLLYDFHFRNLNDDGLTAIYEIILEQALKKNIIMP